MDATKEQKHFVLVHGACHGAWSWYKLKPRLEAAGYRVTVPDLAASGIHRKEIHDVYTMREYTEPLLQILASLPAGEKVVLVGHSLGGLNLAVAMELFPEKISAAVFLTAFMPDTAHPPSYVLQQYCESAPAEAWMDTQFSSYGSNEEPRTSMFFGPKFLSSKLYQLCPVEDLELAKTLIRPSSLFIEDLSKAKNFSEGGYGSVKRVYVVCNEDNGIPEEFQRWMIEIGGLKDVVEIKDADHMPMFSKPQQLCHCLSKIAHKYT